jgi:hypothetical protein
MIPKIDFLDKPAGVLCKHYKQYIGCELHDKPEYFSVCRNYQCLYKNPALNLSQPDTVGYIFSSSVQIEDALIVAIAFKDIPNYLRFEEVVKKFEVNNHELIYQQKIVYWTYVDTGLAAIFREFPIGNHSKRIIQMIDDSKSAVSEKMNK